MICECELCTPKKETSRDYCTTRVVVSVGQCPRCEENIERETRHIEKPKARSDQWCQCLECKDYAHKSNCAVHNEPALPKGECDCKEPKECGCPSNVIACCHDPKCPHPAHALEKPKEPFDGCSHCMGLKEPNCECECHSSFPAEVEGFADRLVREWDSRKAHGCLKDELRELARLARKAR